MKKVVIIDGQGGRLGQMVTERISRENLSCELYAVGTNTAATTAMLKAGAAHGATGENPVVVACRDADVIIGPIGILAADSMYGEITPAMAQAVGQCRALKLLLPISHCDYQVIGVQDLTMSELTAMAVERLKTVL